jgi:prepilin-type processing-associated H-X9-DG protein
MKPRRPHHTNQGTALFEVVIVVLVLAFLAVLAPMIAQSKRKFDPITCSHNVKLIVLAYHEWAGDHNDKLPMELSVTNGGTMELMNTPDAWKTFQVMSNELSTPKFIICPQDSRHTYATNFDTSLKNGISYLIAASATDTDPQLLLSGDDDFLLNGSPVKSGPMNMVDSDNLQWDTDRHGGFAGQSGFKKPKKYGSGNIAFTDGSVQGATDSGLTNALHLSPVATNRLFIP